MEDGVKDWLEDRTNNGDVLAEVVEDSEQYCVTCGQSIPKK